MEDEVDVDVVSHRGQLYIHLHDVYPRRWASYLSHMRREMALLLLLLLACSCVGALDAVLDFIFNIVVLCVLDWE